MSAIIRKFFKIDELGSTISTEIIAGMTTFLTMSYIIFVNPGILSATGMPFNGVLVATVLVSALCSILMGLLANLPYAIAPGMGINAFFTFSLVIGQGLPWQTALGAVFISGVIFLLLTLGNIRKMIVLAIPINLRRAIAAGIGLFLAFIGMKNAGLIVGSDATLVTSGNITSAPVLLFLFGLLLCGILIIYRIKSALLIGIVATTALGIITGNAELPEKILSQPDFTSVFFKLDIAGALTTAMIIPIFTLLFTDMFDSISTFIGVAQVSNLLDKDGQPKNVQSALFVDSIATLTAGLFGTSSGTAYIESAAGVRAGGRTGLTAIVTGLLFLPFLFIADLIKIVPGYATAPVLVIIGVYMCTEIAKIEFDKYDEGIPAFLAIILIPLTFSISQGIVWGFITYTVFKLAGGKRKELHPMMYVIVVFSVLALLAG